MGYNTLFGIYITIISFTDSHLETEVKKRWSHPYFVTLISISATLSGVAAVAIGTLVKYQTSLILKQRALIKDASEHSQDASWVFVSTYSEIDGRTFDDEVAHGIVTRVVAKNLLPSGMWNEWRSFVTLKAQFEIHKQACTGSHVAAPTDTSALPGVADEADMRQSNIHPLTASTQRPSQAGLQASTATDSLRTSEESISASIAANPEVRFAWDKFNTIVKGIVNQYALDENDRNLPDERFWELYEDLQPRIEANVPKSYGAWDVLPTVNPGGIQQDVDSINRLGMRDYWAFDPIQGHYSSNKEVHNALDDFIRVVEKSNATDVDLLDAFNLFDVDMDNTIDVEEFKASLGRVAVDK